jgi:hypothetical protein
MSGLDTFSRKLISGKDLRPEWMKFLEQIKGTLVYSKKLCLFLYKKLLESRPIDDKKYNEGCNALLWLLSNGHINRKTFCIAISELT